MKNKKNNFDKKTDSIEDSTKYGEFISSFFGWETPDTQKEIVEKLQNITKDKNKKREKKKNKEN